MTINRIVRTLAGTFILLSLALGVEASPLFHSMNWLWFTVFVGTNLLQSGITRWCLMDQMLAKLGVPATEHCMPHTDVQVSREARCRK